MAQEAIDEAGQPPVPTAQPWLWARIEGWRLPNVRDYVSPKDSFFEALMRLGGWTEADTVLVIREYRRFLYLKALTGETLTPPEVIWPDPARLDGSSTAPRWTGLLFGLGMVCVAFGFVLQGVFGGPLTLIGFFALLAAFFRYRASPIGPETISSCG